MPCGGNRKSSTVPATAFAVKYNQQDIALLAGVDCEHGWLSGPATVRIIQRDNEQFGKTQYARRGGISLAHLYLDRATSPSSPIGG